MISEQRPGDDQRCLWTVEWQLSEREADSATADLAPLAGAGLTDDDSGWERMHDTVIPAKLADPASTAATRD